MKVEREAIDEALAKMFSSTEYQVDYLFYAHMISQCSITIDETLPSYAGVAFMEDHYNLYLNNEMMSTIPVQERLGVLKHEMLHILNNHVFRAEERTHEPWNYSTDCAINQLITKTHLPEGGILPDNFPVGEGKTIKDKQHAEFYYDLIDFKDPEDSDLDGDSDGQDGDSEDSKQGKPSKPSKAPNHDKWKESKGDKDLLKDMTKKMIEQSIQETEKSKGNIPQEISDMLSMFTREVQVDWRRVLKNITGNKRANKRSTIMKKPRRFKNRPDLKGTTKDRTFTLVVGVDVSGSMSNKEILNGLNEIHHICKSNNTKMEMVQIDTEIHKIETFSRNTKLFERTGAGGTYMGDCVKYLKENRIEHDALVMISDCYIEDLSTDDNWLNYSKRVIWLSTEDITPPGIEKMSKHSCYSIKDKS